jgi:hypothetical protein
LHSLSYWRRAYIGCSFCRLIRRLQYLIGNRQTMISPSKLKVIHSVIVWTVGQSVLRHRMWQKLLLCSVLCLYDSCESMPNQPARWTSVINRRYMKGQDTAHRPGSGSFMWYGDGLDVRSSIPGRRNINFCAPHRPDQLGGPHSLLSIEYRGVKRMWREAGHSSPSSAEVKNIWATRLHAVMLN